MIWELESIILGFMLSSSFLDSSQWKSAKNSCGEVLANLQRVILEADGVDLGRSA